jgi:hypothetical protein
MMWLFFLALEGLTRIGGSSGVEVYKREDVPITELFAEGDIEAPIDAVRAVLIDYDRDQLTLSKRVIESRILRRSPQSLQVYQRMHFPIIHDRDSFLRVEWSDTWVRYRAEPGLLRQGVVRLPINEGMWRLESVRGGAATHVQFHIRIDLDGSVPVWMVRGGAAKELPQLFMNLQKRARARCGAAEPPTC